MELGSKQCEPKGWEKSSEANRAFPVMLPVSYNEMIMICLEATTEWDGIWKKDKNELKVDYVVT